MFFHQRFVPGLAIYSYMVGDEKSKRCAVIDPTRDVDEYLEIVLAYVCAAANKSILHVLIILTTASFFVPVRIEHPFLMAAVLVLFAQDVLGVGPQGYGLLMTVTAAGAVLGALVVPSFAHRVHPTTALTAGLAILGTTALTVGLTRDVPMFVLCYLFTGFAATWWNITLISLFQRLTPDRLRSRAFSAHRTLSWGMLSVGMALGGTLASTLEGVLGREWALAVPYLVAGTIGLILAVVVALRLTRGVIDRALNEAEPA